MSRLVTTQKISSQKNIIGNRRVIVVTVEAAAVETAAVMTVHALFKIKKFEYPHDLKS